MNRMKCGILSLVLGLVFLLSTGLTLRQLWQYRSAQQAQAQAHRLAYTPTVQQATVPQTTAAEPEQTEPVIRAEQAVPLDPEAQSLFDIDLAQLREVNEDVLGWIHIPDTDISFPLMRSYDNEDYLYHAWDGAYSTSGSIFLECKNSPDLLDFNSIVYGHHIRNGTVFASLLEYKSQQYRDDHPCIYILTGSDLRRYRVFSAYEAPIDSDTYRLYYPDEEAKQTAIEHFVGSSVLEYELTPTTDDYILTLSTCTGTGDYSVRWVVQGVLDGIWVR